MAEKYVAIADLHSRSDVLKRVVDEYDGQDVRYVALGDSVGRGPDTAGVLDLLQREQAKITWGNWEFYRMAGLLHHDLAIRDLIQNDIKPFSFSYSELQNDARSYGINPNSPSKSLIESITKAMQERGHLDLLARAAMYFETDDFIAIHAGLTDESWSKQKEDLIKAQKTFEAPIQVVDDPIFTLSRQQKAFEATDKIVITGHSHIVPGPRVTALGKRVRLASQLSMGEPLHVWQSWDGQIKSFDQR